MSCIGEKCIKMSGICKKNDLKKCRIVQDIAGMRSDALENQVSYGQLWDLIPPDGSGPRSSRRRCNRQGTVLPMVPNFWHHSKHQTSFFCVKNEHRFEKTDGSLDQNRKTDGQWEVF